MHIGLIVTGGVDRGGEERVIPAILWLIERLARRHQLTVIVFHQYPEPCSYEVLGAKVYNLGDSPRLPFGWIPAYAGQLRDIERAEGRFDVLHAFWGTKTGWLAAMYARARGIPAVVTLFGGELVGLPDIGYGAQLSLKGRVMVSQVLRWSRYLTVQSESMQNLAATRGRQAEHLPVGVDESCFQPRLKSEDRRRLLQVASLNRVKDQASLLQAMAEVVRREPDVHLDIVGVDTLDGEMQRLAGTLNIGSHVTFHGFLPQREVRPFYQAADLFVLTSRHEGGPIAVLEAAACGVPTVGTRVGHVADWDGREAAAVAVADPEALAEAIVSILNDEARRTELGEAARRWVTRFSADFTAERFEEIFATLISSPRGARAGVGSAGVSLDY